MCYPEDVMKFFVRNIGNGGRLVRGISGVVCVLGGSFAGRYGAWLGVGLMGGGAFMLFEAFRGWCVVRVCGIKTKL